MKRGAGIPANLPLTPAVFNQYKRELFEFVGIDRIPTDPKQIPTEIANLFLEEFNLPSIPKLTPEGLLNEGLKLLPRFSVPLPFPLPTKIPTNLNDLIEVGLQLAYQQFGPQLLAMVGLGSAVPGIGNAVAFAVAILTQFLDTSKLPSDKVFYPCRLHGDIKTNPFGDPCSNKRGSPPTDAMIHSATPLLTIATLQYLNIQALVVLQGNLKEPSCPGRRSGKYDKTQILQCVTDTEFAIRDRYYPNVKNSAYSASLPMVKHALMIYDEAQKLINRNTFKTSESKTSYTPRFEQESNWMIDGLKARKAQLETLANDIINLSKEPWTKDAFASASRIGKISALKERVIEETKSSAISAQIARIVRRNGTEGMIGASKYWVDQNTTDFMFWLSLLNRISEIQTIENGRYNAFKAAIDEKYHADEAKRLRADLEAKRLRDEREQHRKLEREEKRRKEKKRRRDRRERRARESREREVNKEIAKAIKESKKSTDVVTRRIESRTETARGIAASSGMAAILWWLLI